MKGNINIKVTDKDGKLKKEVNVENAVLPTYKHRINAFLPNLQYLSAGTTGTAGYSFPILDTANGSYTGISIHQDLFDVVLGSEEYIDLQYKTPYLLGGISQASSSVYTGRVEQSSEFVDSSFNHYIKSTWLWTSPHSFTIRSLSLKNSSFTYGGFFNMQHGMLFGNYLYTTGASNGGVLIDITNKIPSLSLFANVIDNTSKIDVDGYLHPLYNSFVALDLTGAPDYNRRGPEIYIYSYANIQYVNEDVLDANPHWTRHIHLPDLPNMTQSDFEGYYNLVTVPCVSNDYLVFMNQNTGIKIYKIDRSGSNDQLIYSESVNYVYGSPLVIGDVVHIYGDNSFIAGDQEIFIKESGGDFDSIESRIGDFYPGDSGQPIKYLYRHSANPGVSRDETYYSKIVEGQIQFDDGEYASTIGLYDNSNFLNQTYKNLSAQDQLAVDIGDRVLVTYTVSLEGESQQ